MKKPTAYHPAPYEAIRGYLLKNGVEPFWASSAMENIQRVLAGNRHFVRGVSRPRLRVEAGHVARFSCLAEVWREGAEIGNARLVYTFRACLEPSGRYRAAHRVKLTPTPDKI